MRVSIECKYCGCKWEDNIYNTSDKTCDNGNCNSKNLIFKEITSNSKIDYYQGAPPFPPKEISLKNEFENRERYL